MRVSTLSSITNCVAIAIANKVESHIGCRMSQSDFTDIKDAMKFKIESINDNSGIIVIHFDYECEEFITHVIVEYYSVDYPTLREDGIFIEDNIRLIDISEFDIDSDE